MVSHHRSKSSTFEPNHEVLRKVFVVEPLEMNSAPPFGTQHSHCSPIPPRGKIHEETATSLVILPLGTNGSNDCR